MIKPRTRHKANDPVICDLLSNPSAGAFYLAAVSVPDQGLETSWLICALGRSRAPSALQALAEEAERGRGSHREAAANGYALARKGEPGKQVLARLSGQKSEMREAAHESGIAAKTLPESR